MGFLARVVRQFLARWQRPKPPALAAPGDPADASTSPVPPVPRRATEVLPHIEVYDGYGRQLQMTRDQWRENVLLPQIATDWEVPENLYQIVTNAVRDGFEGDVLDAAKHIATSYPDRDVYVNALGCVLLQLGKYDEAAKAFEGYFHGHPKTGYMLANLAKAYKAKGQNRLADETLWQAIKLDPNQKEGLLWWLSLAQQRGGAKARAESLRAASSLADSWRPQLLTAQDALEAGDAETAKRLYETVMPLVADNGEALLMMSGALGNYGSVYDVVGIVAPIYDPDRHGPLPGMNLLQAYLATKDVARGSALLHKLFEMHMPMYHDYLVDMAQRFDELRREEMPPPTLPDGPAALQLFVIEHPLWYLGLGDPRWLLPEKPRNAQTICFVPFSHLSEPEGSAGPKLEDDNGRMTRAIPLYLMESLLLRTAAAPFVVMPVMEQVGPALFGSRWTRESVSGILGRLPSKVGVVVTGSITSHGDDVAVDITVWDVAEMAELEAIARRVPAIRIAEAVAEIERDLVAFLELPLHVDESPLVVRPDRLTGEALHGYLHCLGQSVALMLVRYGACPLSALWGERALIGSPLSLAVAYEQAQAARILFLANLWFDRDGGSNIYTEFRLPATTLLQQSQPGSPLYNLSPLLFKVFDMGGEYERRKEELARTARGPFASWLAGI